MIIEPLTGDAGGERAPEQHPYLTSYLTVTKHYTFPTLGPNQLPNHDLTSYLNSTKHYTFSILGPNQLPNQAHEA